MTIGTSLGSTLGVSATLPATYNAAGYNALTFTTVNFVDKISAFGMSFAVAEFTPLASGVKQKFAGIADGNSITFSMASDTDDAGQIALRTAKTSKSKIAILITRPNGDKYYARCLVSSIKTNLAGAGDVSVDDVEMPVDGNSDGVLFVEVLAP